ncbi:hypothetical protein SUNI508_02831 [Seiridium unicorne]|uniref:Fungal specific transcription factor n=1 Tax=Seiridium unicorne TaxID=138068 RepID=A0ABR2VIY6_9PEZI
MASASSQNPPSPPVQTPQEASTVSEPGTTASTDKQPLPLPEPSKDGESVTLNVGGEGVRLDHMGPLVVNQDGSMSRISNWAEMSEIERENTLRIVGKRNQQRLKKLREAAGAGAEGSK